MNTSQFFSKYFKTIERKISSIDIGQLEQIAEIALKIHYAGKKIIIFGNGGSAAMASHVAVDFTKAAGIRAINFNEADLITCFANDYGYEHWVAKALEAYADPGDLVILISSSGKSPNMLNGAKKAKKLAAKWRKSAAGKKAAKKSANKIVLINLDIFIINLLVIS